MEKERNCGLDLLRIVSMLMVAVLHVLGQGGVMARTGMNDATYFTCYFLETLCLCAVNCYGLLSGYVGVRASFKARKLAGMILTVELYSILIGLLFGLPNRSWLDRDTLLKIFLPVQWKTYWYYSAYLALYLLMPFLNRGVRALTRREKSNLMSVIFMLFSVLPMAAKTFSVDFLSLVGGYSLIWLIILYVFGACVRELEEARQGANEEEGETFWERILAWRIPLLAAVLALSTTAAWLWKVLVDTGVIRALPDTALARMLLVYHAPTMLINGLAMLLLFRRIKVSSGRVRSIVMLLSPSAFYVYIIHTHPLIWDHLLKGALGGWKSLHPAVVLFPVLGLALCIYLACSGIDIGRRRAAKLVMRRKT